MKNIITKFEAYLLTEKCVSTHTHGAYKKDVQQYLDFLESKKIQLEKAKLSDLKLFLYHLKKEKFSARTICRKISALKTFYAYLQNIFNLENLTIDLTFPKTDRNLPNFLTEKEVESILASAAKCTSHINKRNYTMLLLLYVSGMRISELVQLKTSDIDFESGFVKISGKGGKERIVPIPLLVLKKINDYISTARKFLLKKKESCYLFPVIYGEKTKAISRQSFWTWLKQLCKKNGIKNTVSPHKFRHSLATHLLKNGADLRSLQHLLGHENISTVGIYTHLENSYVRKIYDKKHPRS